MGAFKDYLITAAEAGVCPLGRESFDYLDRLEDDRPDIDWIGYRDEVIEVRGDQMLVDGIDAHAAIRLHEAGLANDEIEMFAECFGHLLDDCKACSDCL